MSEFSLRPFSVDSNDPFASEHGSVAQWVEDSMEAAGDTYSYSDSDLKSLPSGELLLKGDAEQSRRYVVAAVEQCRHWDQQVRPLREQLYSESIRINVHTDPRWQQVWGRRRESEVVVKSLMRRKLPFLEDDLIRLLNWCNTMEDVNVHTAPVKMIAKALERFCADHKPGSELEEAMCTLGAGLRTAYEKDSQQVGTRIELLCGPLDDPGNENSTARLPPPTPASAGREGILEPLKRLLGTSDQDLGQEPAETIQVGPDQFEMAADSPLATQHQLLSQLFDEVVGSKNYSRPRLKTTETGQEILALGPQAVGQVYLAALERHVHALTSASADYSEHRVWQSQAAACGTPEVLSKLAIDLTRCETFDALLYLSAQSTYSLERLTAQLDGWIKAIEDGIAEEPLTEGERYVLSLLRVALLSGHTIGGTSPMSVRISRLINDGAQFSLIPGEFWADRVNQDSMSMTEDERQSWLDWFRHLLTAKSSRPSKKWLNNSEKLLQAVDKKKAVERVAQWLPLVSKGRSKGQLGNYTGDARGAADTMIEDNALCLRGLLWSIPLLPDAPSLIRLISAVAMTAYKKVPGVGPRAVKVGNAAIFALSQMPSAETVGQLAMLKVRVKFGTAQKEIEKAFTAAAEAIGLKRDEIEEIGVPTYGLDQMGSRCEQLAD